MTNATMNPPELEEELDVPEDPGAADGGDDDGGPAFLVTFRTGGYEVIELVGTDDEEVPAADLVDRFNQCERNGSVRCMIGRRWVRCDDVRTLGPADEVDFPEVSVFNLLEERTEKLLRSVEQAVGAVAHVAQNVAYLVQQQGALQQAQAELFQSVGNEEYLEGGNQQEAESAKSAGGAGLRPLKVPGVASGKPKRPS